MSHQRKDDEKTGSLYGPKVSWALILIGLMGSLVGCTGESDRTSSLDLSAVATDPPPGEDLEPIVDPDPNSDTGSQPGPDPTATPTIDLVAGDDVVASGSPTTLTWTTRDATGCSANGGWSGNRTTSGSETVGPLIANTTYSLSCSGAGGSALVMITVSVTGVVQLSWVAPSENVDGSALTDLVGYKIYYGVSMLFCC